MRILTPWSMSCKILAKSSLSISILSIVVSSRCKDFLCGQLNMRGMYSQVNVPGDWEVSVRYRRWGRNPGISVRMGDEDKCRRRSSITYMADVLSEHGHHSRFWRHGTASNNFLRSSRTTVSNVSCFKELPERFRSEVKLSVSR